MVKEDRIQVSVLLDSRRAINELGKMEMEAKDAALAMKGLRKGTEEYAQASRRLEEATAQVQKLRGWLGLAGMSMQQLRRYHGELKRAIDRETYGTPQWKALEAQIKAVNKAIKEQRDELAGTNTFWSRIKAEVKQFGMMAVAYLGVQELFAQVQSLVRGMADLSDAMADVQKTTGLAAGEVEALNGELKRLDTRTSSKDLLGLAEIAGKLGVKAKEDVLAFVKAADQLNVALGKDLGTDAEGAIKAVGKLVDIFKVKDRFGLEQGLLKVGSAINSLGAESTASEGYLVDFAKRLGGIAPNANISVQNVLGLAATLDQLGQSSEASSTAVSQLFVALAQDIPAFSKLAGLSVKEFSDLLANDANEAFIKVLEGSRSTSGGLAGMASTLTKLGIDGARAAAVVGVLSNNIGLLRDKQRFSNEEFEKGTSLSQEFAVKNSNLAATLEKVQKRLASMMMNGASIKMVTAMVEGIESLTRRNEDLTGGLREQEQSLSRQRQEFNAMLSVLQKGNASQETRRRIIEELNSKYREYLPGLVTERTEAAELARMMAKGNEEFVRKIYLMGREADMMEAINKMRKAEMALKEDEDRLARAAVKAEQERAKALALHGGKAGSMFDKGNDEGLKSELRPTGVSGGYARMETEYGAASRTYEQLGRNVAKRKEEIAALQATIDKEGELFAKVMERFRLKAGDGSGPEAGASGGEAILPAGKADADSKQKERDLEALADRWRQFQEEVRKIEDGVHTAGQSREAQEFARISEKYEALRQKAQEFRDQGIVAESAFQEEMLRINAAYSEELKAAQDAANAERAEKAKAFHSEMEALAMDALPDEAQEFARIDAKYEALMQKARDFHAEGLISEEEFYLAMADINARYSAEHLAKQDELNRAIAEKNKALRKKELDEQADYYSGLGNMLSEFSSLISATNRLIATQGAKQSEFQKQLALIAIGIDTAAALSKAIAGATSAAAATGPAAPFTLAGYILSMGTAVLSGMAKAQAMLKESNKAEVPSFAKGGPVGGMPLIEGEGFTGAGLPFRDATGKRPAGLALLHGNEYVVPESLLFGNPWVADQVAIIEALRLGRGFAQGGPSGEMPIPRPEGGQGMEQVLARLEAIERAVLRLDRPMRAYFTADDGEAYDEYRAQDESNRNISKL